MIELERQLKKHWCNVIRARRRTRSYWLNRAREAKARGDIESLKHHVKSARIYHDRLLRIMARMRAGVL